MPEGPEVKIITEQLASKLVDKSVDGLWILGGRFLSREPDGTSEFHKELSLKILEINCKGKFIYWKLEHDWSLWNTLGMTGEWGTDSESKHKALKFWIKDGKNAANDFAIFFNDVRHFGTVKFVKGAEKLEKKLNSLGPDMLSAPPSLEIFNCIIAFGKNKTIAEILMDQKYVSGVGNYIKAESLYRSKLSPWRKCNSLTPSEIELLYQEIQAVLQESYKAQGNTFSTYKNVLGESGRYVEQLKVYGKQKDPLGNVVKSEETKDKRTTWWVPGVQK